jgi:hypothetical protein
LLSTISGNQAAGAGGGIRNVSDGVIAISASTITKNKANAPTGPGVVEPDPYGGGIYNSETARVYMSNTILAGNEDMRSRYDANYSPDCYSATRGRFTSYRDNLIGILTDNCFIQDSVTGDTSFELFGTPLVALDPRLDPLGYYGGSTATHRLRYDSPAIDADLHHTGNVFYDCQDKDQRLSPRPLGRACDIGAYELK